MELREEELDILPVPNSMSMIRLASSLYSLMPLWTLLLLLPGAFLLALSDMMGGYYCCCNYGYGMYFEWDEGC